MDYQERVEGMLLDGESINLIGISGSGRSATLAMIKGRLESDVLWAVEVWQRGDLDSSSRSEKLAAIDDLRRSDGVPVLMIDDYGDYLVEPDGKWLDQMLFAAVNEEPSGSGEYLRCLVVTAPRDREIQVAGSGLRDRCKTLHPVRPYVSEEVRGRFGCEGESELLDFCGGTHLLAPGSGQTAQAERGTAMQRARLQATHWVGQLGPDHHARLSDLLGRSQGQGSQWRAGGIDEFLVPLVTESGRFCRVIGAVRAADVSPLLLSERWPESDLTNSAKRFAARCGNEPKPLWVDTFLSDLSTISPTNLVAFLSSLLQMWSDGRRLQMLSRDYLSGLQVRPHEMAATLEQAGLDVTMKGRIDWRIFDQRSCGKIHKRLLVLPGRGAVFDLPPASVLLGEFPVGNESDAEMHVRDHSVVREAWNLARPLW